MTECMDDGHSYEADVSKSKDIQVTYGVEHCHLYTCVQCGDRRWAPTERSGQPIFPAPETWPPA